MNLLTISAIFTLIVTTCLSATNLALHRKRRSAIQDRFDKQGKEELGQWLLKKRRAIVLTISLLRTAGAITFLVLVLVEVVGFGESSTLTSGKLLVTGVIAISSLWLFSTVIALAIAEHAGIGLIVTTAPALKIAALTGLPLSRVFFFIDEAVRRLSGANLRDVEVEAELLRSIEETHREGGLDPESAAMLENIVEFRTTDVAEVMTPRTDIEGIELTNDLAEIRGFITRAGHSRIPVFENDLDHIVGILYVKDLITYLGSEVPDFDLKSMLRKPIVIPETKPVPALLADFQQSEVHLAIVIDEYGGTAGLVTIEDILEEIVGEIHDEHEPDDDEEPTFETIDETHSEVDGRYHIDDLNEHLGLNLPEDDDYDTVAGFVLAQLGRVPRAGDNFESHNARFTAIVASETHIQRIGIELLTPVAANGRSGHGKNNGNGK